MGDALEGPRLKLLLAENQLSAVGGVFVVDPALLPQVCCRCGLAGGLRQTLRFLSGIPSWKLRTQRRILLLSPLIFGVLAGLAYLIGQDVFELFLPWGFGALVMVMVGCWRWRVLRMNLSRMQCQLTYFLCQPCGENFLSRRKAVTRIAWCIGILLVLSILGPVLMERISPPIWVWRLGLFSLWGGFLAAVIAGGLVEIMARRYIGFKAVLEIDPTVLVLSFRRAEAAARIKALSLRT